MVSRGIKHFFYHRFKRVVDNNGYPVPVEETLTFDKTECIDCGAEFYIDHLRPLDKIEYIPTKKFVLLVSAANAIILIVVLERAT